MTSAETGLVKLLFTLKDERGQSITAPTRIVVQEASLDSHLHTYCAESKRGEVTHFALELLPGTYSVEVEAEGFQVYNQLISASNDQENVFSFVLSLAGSGGDEEEGDTVLLEGRFAWFVQQRTYPGQEFPSDAREKALEQKRHMDGPGVIGVRSKTVFPICNWLSIGPRNVNGRVRALAIHPTDGNTVYAGSANAGVWVTHDAGQSWKPLMHDQDALEIGALAVHLTDPAKPAGDVTIYAGTGEPTLLPSGLVPGLSGMPFYKGIGILKSTNSGATWNSAGALPSPGNDSFSAILVDPTSITANSTATKVYAGGPGGLYKSTDGGANWTLILSKNITCLALDPTNSAILYAAVAFEGIYKYDPATNVWNTFNAGLTTPSPFPQLILIAIGQSAPHTMYAKLDQMVYTCKPPASTWQPLCNHGGQTYGYWNNVLGVDPKDSNIVFAGGRLLERSSDGGKTWQSAGALHDDQHALVFDSTNHLNVYVCDDGGVYHGTYPTATSVGTWGKVSDGLVLTQFNQVGVFAGDPRMVGGGTQDNGTNRTVGGLTWDPILGGDGGDLIIDPANPYILYAQEIKSVSGKLVGTISKSLDGGASWHSAINGFPGGPWVTPIVLDSASPAEPNRVLFAGGNSQVYRTTNSAGSWTPSSPVLNSPVTAITLAPSSSAIVYVGTSSGSVWRSSDNGATIANWKNITGGNIDGSTTLPSRWLKHIAVSPTMPDIIYLAFSGFNTITPETPGHVFRGTSIDGWAAWKWENISSDLPDIPVNAIAVDLSSPNTLYIGTDIGVFRTTDSGLHWSDFGTGLPNVVISDLALNATGDLLRAATYGYGIFELHLGSTCPSVDVYMRDNKLDIGQALPSPSGVADPTKVGDLVFWWQSVDIMIDAFPYRPVPFDGVEFDLTPSEAVIPNDATHPNPNRLYVQVHNRGPLFAHNVKVKVLWTDASAGLPPLPADFWTSYPNDWKAVSAWHTVDPKVPYQVIPELLPETPKILRWDWVVPVTAVAPPCILAVISADEDPVVHSDAVSNDHLLWFIAPNDKHITLRNLHVITAGTPAGPPALMSRFSHELASQGVFVTEKAMEHTATSQEHSLDTPPQKPVPERGLFTPLKTSLNFHNAFPYPQFFDIILDKRSLPKGSQLKLLLPKGQPDLPAILGHAKDLILSEITDKEPWWDLLKDLLKEEWQYICHIIKDDDNKDDDDCKTHVVRIPRVLIPANEALRVTLFIWPPITAKPGSTYQFTIMQGLGDTLIGGSTYEVRIPPAEIPLHEC
jgi:photosystem II stability/assembly factor-like uncharacterized protein